ncbi:unnamed protein product [Phytophthora fragariaefolia]|uniref:Unnamed protein product n=1 Tax=Phytophthora fragariaefolia TaxID=1490495 RepID=A0A9W6X6F3_9STRA|nr:unnamed protein product [Phytophthora fragariaefolia]
MVAAQGSSGDSLIEDRDRCECLPREHNGESSRSSLVTRDSQSTISNGDRMPEGVAFESPEHTPRARCEISTRQIPPRHPRIQRFGGLAGRRDVGGKGSQNDNNRPPSAEDVGSLEVQEEQRRVGMAQDEELRWTNLKLVLKGESSSLGYKTAREAWKMADRFWVSDDGLLYFLGENRRWGKDRVNETVHRVVVPTMMVQEMLLSCHDSLEGGHQGRVQIAAQVRAALSYEDIPWKHPVRPATPDCVNRFRHPTTEVSEGQHRSVAISVRIHGIWYGGSYV